MSLSVAVCIPTYCEAENIAEILRRVRKELPDATILIGDDNSPDGTAAIARAVGEELGNVDVILNRSKAGLGEAYRRLYRIASDRGFDAVIQLDADLSHDPAELPDLVAHLDAGADLVIGTRYIPGGSTPDWPLIRRVLSTVGNRYAAMVLRLSLRDVTSGYRAYLTSTLAGIDFGTTRATGYGFQIEMAYRSVRRGFEIVEHPIVFKDRTLGESKLNLKVAFEELWLVTWWGLRDLFRPVPAAVRRRSGSA